MNIMRVLFPYVGDTFGGSHRSSLLLVQGLNQQHGVEAITAIHNGDGVLSDYLTKNRLEYVVLPSVMIVDSRPLVRQIAQMVKAALPLMLYLKKQSIDIVHVNDRRMHLTWLLATRFAGKKLVWHQRNPVSSRRVAWYSRLASEIITVSEYCKSSFVSSMRRRAIVVSNPVSNPGTTYDYAASRAQVVDELGLNKDCFIVSWVSNWIKRKRPLDFVELAEATRKRASRKVVFLMFGEPREPVGEVVRWRIRDAGLEECVYVMGSRTPIEPYIQGSDLLVATAEAEGHGRTLIEGMMLRTPVIATADGGHLEIIEDGEDGWLVPVGDIDAMADATMVIMQSPLEVKRRVDAAERKVKQQFSLELHVRSIMQIYEKCLR
jgi:glycosyltransferase involved in cell wall biosynthesis